MTSGPRAICAEYPRKTFGIGKRHISLVSYINTFDHEGTVVINVMRDLTAGVFEHLEIILPTDVDKRPACTQRIRIGSAL